MQHSVERRVLLEAIRVRLAESPVVALLGARQVGKTTLARQVAADWPGPKVVFDLETPGTFEALQATPEKLLSEQDGLVIVDEVQRLPGLFTLLRPICDNPARRAVFLLLGSASWDLVRGVTETLAGRVQFVDVFGFSLAEVGARELDRLGCEAVSPALSSRKARRPGSDGWRVSPGRFSNATFRGWDRVSRRRPWAGSGGCSLISTARSGMPPSWRARWM